MQILTAEGWEFEALEAGFSSIAYYKLWDHILYNPCKHTDIEIDRILTGFLNSSCPPGHSDYEDAAGWGYTPDEQKLLEIYYDDDGRMSHKRVFYSFELQNELVTKVHFFLRWSDAGFDETVHETRASRGMKEDFH
jgi:hypothetical protein